MALGSVLSLFREVLSEILQVSTRGEVIRRYIKSS